MSYWEEYYRKIDPFTTASDGWLEKYAFVPGEQVLDLGCGAGTNIPFLLNKKTIITAADLSENAIAQIQHKFGSQLSSGCFDMCSGIPYPDDSFDTVISDLSLHYFSWEDTQRIFQDLRRILKEGGRLIARVHSIENLPVDAEYIAPGYYRAYGYERRYFTREDIEKILSGWQIEVLQSSVARRYGRKKHVFEFCAHPCESFHTSI